MEGQEENKKSWLKSLKHPVNIITLSIAILGIILSIYFFSVSKKERGISYQIIEPISKIYDNKNVTSTLKLLENDSTIITNNVYLVTGKIWNSGNLSILKSDIRKPLIISVGKGNRILDYEVLKQNDSEIAKFKLSKINNNTLQIDWEYFDPKFGFSYQIIYTGKEECNIEINGKILDISKFNKVEFLEFETSAHISFVFLILIFGIATIFLFIELRREKDVFSYFLFVICFSAFCVVIYFYSRYYIFSPTIPI